MYFIANSFWRVSSLLFLLVVVARFAGVLFSGGNRFHFIFSASTTLDILYAVLGNVFFG